jgi:hypothetical protein
MLASFGSTPRAHRQDLAKRVVSEPSPQPMSKTSSVGLRDTSFRSLSYSTILHPMKEFGKGK